MDARFVHHPVNISVIIPTLNEAETIATTVRLTANLGFDEIIVVDGGSTDQTGGIVDSVLARSQHSTLGTIRLLAAPRGRARQLNAGAQAAHGDVLLFLHADTHLPPAAKSSIAAALADGTTVGGRFDVQFDRPSVWSYLIGSLMNLRSRATGISTGDQALFVRKKVFEELGGFADIPLMEDVDFSARLKRRGQTVALYDRVITSFRRWERRGPLRTILLMWALRLLYWIGVSPHRLANLYPQAR